MAQLRTKQEIFCQEYLKDLNATQAAVRAGYSKRTAHVDGPRLLSNATIKARVDELLEKRADKYKVTVEMVVKELARISFTDMRQLAKWNGAQVLFLPSSTLTDDQAACIESVSQTKEGALSIKLHSKTKALELLSRYLGMLQDRTDLTTRGKSISPENRDENIKKIKDILTKAAKKAKA
jgi:phage terminase small subunit